MVPFARPPVILGVTNPFFIKSLQHWPHLLRLGLMAYGEIGLVCCEGLLHVCLCLCCQTAKVRKLAKAVVALAA